MPNPKRKHTRSRRDSRRSANWKLDAVPLSKAAYDVVQPLNFGANPF